MTQRLEQPLTPFHLVSLLPETPTTRYSTQLTSLLKTKISQAPIATSTAMGQSETLPLSSLLDQGRGTSSVSATPAISINLICMLAFFVSRACRNYEEVRGARTWNLCSDYRHQLRRQVHDLQPTVSMHSTATSQSSTRPPNSPILD